MPDVEEQGMSFSLAIRIVTILSIDGKSKERANDKQLRLHDVRSVEGMWQTDSESHPHQIHDI